MSSSQRVPRRLSARLQEKDVVEPMTNGHQPATNSKTGAGGAPRNGQGKAPTSRKRKIDYAEEDDGFLFTRAKTRKTRASSSKVDVPPIPTVIEQLRPESQNRSEPTNGIGNDTEPTKKRRNKMSFSTPNVREEKPVRRSKRLSDEHEQREGSPQHKTRRKEVLEPTHPATIQKLKIDRKPEQARTPAPTTDLVAGEEHSATKIALPFADTPVIRRNKAMREGKSGKGERRSSLGLRGRRASSLIDSGTSNALPHNEVEAGHFYKHIESEGLPEPRRMRQLLTWCATRAMSEKPTGQEFEDHSARMAARVIQEELLKDFANRSEMSDWFSREDVPKSAVPLITKPNPKNLQNATKIEELEQQIRRLQIERQSLNKLLRPPSIPNASTESSNTSTHAPSIDPELLSPSDRIILDALASTSNASGIISSRLNSIGTSLEPTIDAFADCVHQIAQYRDAAEHVAGKVLRACADKLEDREKEGRRRALGKDEMSTTKDDIGSVLRSLSKLER